MKTKDLYLIYQFNIEQTAQPLPVTLFGGGPLMTKFLIFLALCAASFAQSIPVGDSTGRLAMSNLPTGIGGQVPTGMIMLTLSSACPSGFTEVSALNGKFAIGTIAANGNVGMAGGASSITPAGTINAQTFTGTSNQSDSAVSAGTPAGTNSTVAYTPAGTNATASFTPAGTNGTVTSGATSAGTPAGTISAISASATAALTSAASAGQNTANNTHTHPAPTFTGSAMSTHTHSIPAEVFTGTSGTIPAEVWTGTPATIGAEVFTGTPLGTHSHTYTAAGTVSQANFTGTSASITPLNVAVLFCSKN